MRLPFVNFDDFCLSRLRCFPHWHMVSTASRPTPTATLDPWKYIRAASTCAFLVNCDLGSSVEPSSPHRHRLVNSKHFDHTGPEANIAFSLPLPDPSSHRAQVWGTNLQVRGPVTGLKARKDLEEVSTNYRELKDFAKTMPQYNYPRERQKITKRCHHQTCKSRAQRSITRNYQCKSKTTNLTHVYLMQ